MPQTGQPADLNSRTECKQVNKELHITNVREMPMVRVSKTKHILKYHSFKSPNIRLYHYWP